MLRRQGHCSDLLLLCFGLINCKSFRNSTARGGIEGSARAVVISNTFDSLFRFNVKLTFDHIEVRRSFLIVFIDASIAPQLAEIFKVLWRKFVSNMNGSTVNGDDVQMLCSFRFRRQSAPTRYQQILERKVGQKKVRSGEVLESR